MTTIVIRGATLPETYRQIASVVGGAYLYVKGVDRDLFVDYGRRSDAERDLEELRTIEGITVEFY